MKSIRSAFNSSRPSTSNKTSKKLTQREEQLDNKNLDIDNYLDHSNVDLYGSKN